MSIMRFPEKLRHQSTDLLIRCLDGIERFVEHIDTIYLRRSIEFNFVELERRPKNEYIGEVLWFIYGIYIAKFRELLTTVIDATHKEDFLVFALCGRSIIETTATLRYYNNKILSVVVEAKNKDQFSTDEINLIIGLLDKHSRGGRFDWTKFFSAPRREMAEQLVKARSKKSSNTLANELPNPSQVNIQTALDAWSKEHPEIVLIYDFFCELVHPNLGSNFMVMGAKSGSLHLCGKTVKGVGRSLTVEGIQFLAPVVKEAASCMASLLGWAAITKPELPRQSK